MLPALNLPQAPLKLTHSGENITVFDEWRKKNLLLTPEEWVRQHVLWYLVNDLQFPSSLLAVEYAITVNKLKRRCDIVAFGKDGKAKLIVECKAPHIKLDEVTFLQIAQYNFNLNVDYLILSNGLDHIIAKINRENQQIEYLKQFPNFGEITKQD